MAKHRNRKKTQQQSSSSDDQTNIIEDNNNVFISEPKPSFTQESLLNEFEKLKDDLKKQINDAKNQIIIELKQENEDLRANLREKDKRIIKLETDLVGLQQYVRRSNIEISGIPDEIQTGDLEARVIDIAESIGV